MGRIGPFLLRAYSVFREPRVFFVIVAAFITVSLTAHVGLRYDPDLGLTNLILSVEATLYGIVSSIMVKSVMKKQDEMAKLQRDQMAMLLNHSVENRELVLRLIAIVEASRATDQAMLDYLRSR